MAPAHELRLLMLLVAVSAVAVALLLAPRADAALPRVEHAPTKADGSLAILVVGDWGRKGTYNQSRVAHQVTTADNYCPGIFCFS